MNFSDFLDVINKYIVRYHIALIIIGVLSFLYGLILCIVNRRAIKVLYFLGGFLTLFVISMLISLEIIAKKVENVDFVKDKKASRWIERDFRIALGCSGGLGIILGALAFAYGKLGIVLVGISIGSTIGTVIGIATKNNIVYIVLNIVFAIIGGTLCGVFKRPAEVVTSGLMGGFLFAFGYWLMFAGALDIQLYNYVKKNIGDDGPEAFEKLAKKGASFFNRMNYLSNVANISALVIGVVFIVVFGGYHIFTYKKNHSRNAEQQLLQKSPAYNPV